MKRAQASKVFLPSRPASWTTEDLRTLRELAGQGCSAEVIAKRLRRTVSSVRNKVVMHGLSLTLRTAESEAIVAEDLRMIASQ
jgi:hypothetical protein